MKNESQLDRNIKKFLSDVAKVVCDRNVSVPGKASLISALSTENPTGALGALIFISFFGVFLFAILYEWL